MVWYWAGPDAVGNAAKALAAATDDAAKAAAQAALDAVNADAGFLFQKGALDFAGGTVVHINAGIAGFVGCLMHRQAHRLRPRPARPALADHDDDRRLAAVGRLVRLQRRLQPRVQRHHRARHLNTFVATAAAAVSWLFVEWALKGKPSLLGMVSGAVAGLVAVTPASGFAGPMGSIVLGLVAGVVCFVIVLHREERARLRRLARRLRRPLRRRHPRRPRDRHPGRPERSAASASPTTPPSPASWSLGAYDMVTPAHHPGEGRRPHPAVVGHRLGDPLQARRPDRSACASRRTRSARASTSPTTASAPTTTGSDGAAPRGRVSRRKTPAPCGPGPAAAPGGGRRDPVLRSGGSAARSQATARFSSHPASRPCPRARRSTVPSLRRSSPTSRSGASPEQRMS